jgi:hypothetical protein
MSETTPPKDNRDFFKNLDEQMEGVAPGLSERVEKLNREHLGRAIVITGKPENNSSDVRELTKAIKSIQGKGSPEDLEDQGLQEENKDYLAGYILPAQADQKQHIVILKTGTIAVMQPEREDDAHIEKYKEVFSPNECPLEYPYI